MTAKVEIRNLQSKAKGSEHRSTARFQSSRPEVGHPTVGHVLTPVREIMVGDTVIAQIGRDGSLKAPYHQEAESRITRFPEVVKADEVVDEKAVSPLESEKPELAVVAEQEADKAAKKDGIVVRLVGKSATRRVGEAAAAVLIALTKVISDYDEANAQRPSPTPYGQPNPTATPGGLVTPIIPTAHPIPPTSIPPTSRPTREPRRTRTLPTPDIRFIVIPGQQQQQQQQQQQTIEQRPFFVPVPGQPRPPVVLPGIDRNRHSEVVCEVEPSTGRKTGFKLIREWLNGILQRSDRQPAADCAPEVIQLPPQIIPGGPRIEYRDREVPGPERVVRVPVSVALPSAPNVNIDLQTGDVTQIVNVEQSQPDHPQVAPRLTPKPDELAKLPEKGEPMPLDARIPAALLTLVTALGLAVRKLRP